MPKEEFQSAAARWDAAGNRMPRSLIEVVEAFATSLHLPDVLHQGHAAIGKLLSADGVASCCSRSASPNDYELAFSERGLPVVSAAVSIGDADPVRSKLLSHPRRLWRDTDFGDRNTYEASEVYRMTAAFGDPAAVMLTGLFSMGAAGHGSFTVYRTSRHAFSQRDRAQLEQLWSVISGCIANCIRFRELSQRADMLDALFALRRIGVIAFDAGGRELMRNERAQELLDAWFNSNARGRRALPGLLREQLRALRNASPLDSLAAVAFRHPSEPRALRVSFDRLQPAGGRRCFALTLEEQTASHAVPATWRERLTPRQQQVAILAQKGWDNATIAAELDCSVGTVKKHLQSVLDKLGVDNRIALIAHSN